MILNKLIQHKWLEALENTDIDPGRFHRGEEYACSGNVEELDINNNEVLAYIEGNHGNYQTEIKFKKLNQDQINKIIEIIKSNPDISTEISNGNIPDRLFDLLEKNGIYLIPKIFDGYYSDCDCADDAWPCKHIVAVYYDLSHEVCKKPLLLFELKGLPVKELFEKTQISQNIEFKLEKSFKQQTKEKLEAFLNKADSRTLKQIILDLTFKSKENYRKCLDIIEDNIDLDDNEKSECSSEKFITAWDEVKWEIKRIEEYGYYEDFDEAESLEIEDKVNKVKEELEKGKASKVARKEFIDDALSNIDNDFDSVILDAIYAACYEKDELLYFAGEIENSQTSTALSIYKELSEKDKYLELLLKHLESCSDYYDLVNFYEENNEPQKAVEIAYQGLQKTDGWKGNLLDYLAKKALDSNNREEYLRLKFDKYINRLSFHSYKSFKSICNEEEWKQYEPEILSRIDKLYSTDKMLIYMYREEFDKAINILVQSQANYYNLSMQSAEFLIAEKLKEKYPAEVIQFYMNSIGNFDSAKDRKTYANQAHIAAKIQDIYENVLKTPEKWNELAKDIKDKNKNRKAFQQEFGKVVLGWRNL